MKKHILSLLFAISISTSVVPPKKAEAGLLLANFSGGNTLLLVGGITVAVVGAYTAVFSIVAPDLAWFYPEFAIPCGVAALILDAQPDVTAEKEVLKKQIGIKYPFIENEAILNELVASIYTKAGITSLKEIKSETIIHFSPEEIDSLFEGEYTASISEPIETLKKDFN